MKYSTFSLTDNDQLQEPMFFGQPVNVARYDQQKYPIFEKLIEKQLSFFWRPEEVDVSQDRTDYRNLPDHEKHIFISNLKYQTLLDSIQGRSPNVAFLPIVSIPELETWIELGHSRKPFTRAPTPILFVISLMILQWCLTTLCVTSTSLSARVIFLSITMI